MPKEPPDFKQPKNHNPELVVGDTLDEVPVLNEPNYPQSKTEEIPFSTPKSHNPELVVGDTLDEVPPPPTLSVPAAPLQPHDVSIQMPDAPWQPHDVSLPQPHTPWQPHDVPVTLPNAPWQPHDVSTPPPYTQTDISGDTIDEVPVTVDPQIDRTLSPPSDVSLPPPHVPMTMEEMLEHLEEKDKIAAKFLNSTGVRYVHRMDDISVRGLIKALENKDSNLAYFIESLSTAGFTNAFGNILGDGAGSRSADVTLLYKTLQNYVKSAGVNVVEFIAMQSALARMNKRYGRIFNPAYVNMLALPSAFNKYALDTYDNVHTDTVMSVDENLIQKIADNNAGELSKLADENIYTKENPYSEGQGIAVGAFTDAAIDGFSEIMPASVVSKVVEDTTPVNGVKRKVVNISKMFDRSNNKLLPQFTARGGQLSLTRENSALVNSAFNWKGSRGAIPSAFSAEDDEFGYSSEQIDDDITYVPLMLQDLRPSAPREAGGKEFNRRVYFRALNVQSSENFAPQWNESEAFGRVDPIVGYKSTGRTISLSFRVHAFSPEDLSVIYKKREWLVSMVYPEIADDLMMMAGPVARLRLGDLYNNSRGGLPGIIKSLDFDDSEQVWELKRGHKVPHGFAVSLSFQVLHEGSPGINNGNFTMLSMEQPTRNQADPSRFEKINVVKDNTLFYSNKGRKR